MPPSTSTYSHVYWLSSSLDTASPFPPSASPLEKVTNYAKAQVGSLLHFVPDILCHYSPPRGFVASTCTQQPRSSPPLEFTVSEGWVHCSQRVFTLTAATEVKYRINSLLWFLSAMANESNSTGQVFLHFTFIIATCLLLFDFDCSIHAKDNNWGIIVDTSHTIRNQLIVCFCSWMQVRLFPLELTFRKGFWYVTNLTSQRTLDLSAPSNCCIHRLRFSDPCSYAHGPVYLSHLIVYTCSLPS